MADRIEQYLKYHADSSKAWDIDIQVEAIQFLTQYHRLSLEQRLWLSFLFACTYCVPTAWYIFRSIPSWNAGTPEQLRGWWMREKAGLLFQTDRKWLKSRNLFPAVVEDYRAMVRREAAGNPVPTQIDALKHLIRGGRTPQERYELLVRNARVQQFGRFAMFLYSELLYHAGLPVVATLNLAEAESVKNGVVFALGMEERSYTGRHGRASTAEELAVLTAGLNEIVRRVQPMPMTARHHSIWSIETTLCAYKKWHLGKRYVGYYAERTLEEVRKMTALHPRFDWKPLNAFAARYYPKLIRRKAK